MTGAHSETTGKAATQSKVRSRRITQVLEIISSVRDGAGGQVQAMAWYRLQPIPALDGRTPEALVKSGNAVAVRAYLDHMALGGFA